MPAKFPGNRSFFKYAAPDTALAILKNGTVRYSSPLTFNDPFDCQTELQFDFDPDGFHERVRDRLLELVTAAEEPQVDIHNPWGRLIALIRENYTTPGFPRELWEQTMTEQFPSLDSEMKTTQSKFQENFRNTLLAGARFFCVSEDCDNLLMWAHYAKDHTGAMFELLSLPEEDNPLSIARPVIYVDHPPPLFTEDEWLDDIFSLRRLDERELVKRYVYSKSRHWSYEREWRVWDSLIPAPECLYRDTPILQSEFAALYIGCRAKDSFADEAMSLTRGMFPNARIYRAQRRGDVYALEYTEI